MSKSALFTAIMAFCWSLGHSQPAHDRKALEDMIAFNKSMKSDRLVVSIQDTTIADVTFRGKPNKRFALYSITKVFSSIAIGILIDQNRIDNPEEPVATYFPEWQHDALKRKVTIRHILQHTSGLAASKGSGEIYPQADFVQFALNSAVATEPGLTFFYNNKAVNIISGIVKKVSGQTLEQFIKENLFTPLGITDYEWKHDNAGNTWGMDGLWMNATDLLKVAQMLGNHGVWNGRQIVSRKWCDLMFQLPLVNCMHQTRGYGMCIRSIPFAETISISDKTIDTLSALGLATDLVEKLKTGVTNKTYSYASLGKQLKEGFSPDEVERLSALASRHLIPLYSITNENYVVMHGGEYGLLMVAFPKKKAVAVRFLGEKWGRKMKADGSEYKYLIDGDIINHLLNLPR